MRPQRTGRRRRAAAAVATARAAAAALLLASSSSPAAVAAAAAAAAASPAAFAAGGAGLGSAVAGERRAASAAAAAAIVAGGRPSRVRVGGGWRGGSVGPVRLSGNGGGEAVADADSSSSSSSSSSSTPSSVVEAASAAAALAYPPPNPGRLEREFIDMLDDFARYGSRDIEAVADARYRALFEGVKAGTAEPAVANAFMIVFKDMVPIRVAGRMIYRHLRSVMEDHMEAMAEEEGRIVSETGLSSDQIHRGRRAFLALTEDDAGTTLTIDQLIDSGIVETAVELFGYDEFDEFVSAVDEGGSGLLDFERFMIGLQRCAEGSTSPECTVPYVLEEIAERMGPVNERRKTVPVDERKQKYSERYDDMVSSFAEWEDRVPTGEGRMLDVLRGCFVGARNEKVVGALKIVYMDYSALRVGGDLVFKVMKKLVGKKKA